MVRTPADLTSEAAIRARSDDFIRAKRIGMAAVRRRLPTAVDLFDLAAEGVVASIGRPSITMLGPRLAAARMMAGQTAASLAGVLGLREEPAAKMTINHYEKGRRRPGEDSLRVLAAVYKVSVLWLSTGVHFHPSGGLCWPDWIEPWHEALIDAKAILRVALNDGKARPLFSDSVDAWSIIEYSDEDAHWRKKWSLPSMMAAMSGVLRACERAQKSADMWTRVAFTSAF